jgi:2-phosphoglycerate kinase
MNLNKVCWIGGPARSGKSSIANRFAENIGVQIFHADDYFGNVMMKKFTATKEEYPNLYIAQNEEEDFIIRKPLNEYINIVMAIHSEIVKMIINDINDLATNDIVIVEGLSLLPDYLNNYGITNALFLSSPQAFFEEKAEFRDKLQTQNDSIVLNDNINAMMISLRSHIQEKAAEFGYKIIPVGGGHTLDINTRLVAEHFSLPIP